MQDDIVDGAECVIGEIRFGRDDVISATCWPLGLAHERGRAFSRMSRGRSEPARHAACDPDWGSYSNEPKPTLGGWIAVSAVACGPGGWAAASPRMWQRPDAGSVVAGAGRLANHPFGRGGVYSSSSIAAVVNADPQDSVTPEPPCP